MMFTKEFTIDPTIRLLTDFYTKKQFLNHRLVEYGDKEYGQEFIYLKN